MPELSEYERLLNRITVDPEDDTARLAFAANIRGLDRDRAEFIVEQIQNAQRRRIGRSEADSFKPALLAKNESRWAHTIAKYASAWTYDRGFIADVTLDPYMFLEYGNWLFVNEPIRAVHFIRPVPDPFPMKELAESPLLERLDCVILPQGLSLEELRIFASSPHLRRLLYLSGGTVVDEAAYDVFAEVPRLRQVLALRFSGEQFPGQEFLPTDRDDYWGAPIWAWRDLTPKGKELEQKYGYIPWLHPKDNSCYHLDAAWFVSQGILPAKQPGSTVDEK